MDINTDHGYCRTRDPIWPSKAARPGQHHHGTRWQADLPLSLLLTTITMDEVPSRPPTSAGSSPLSCLPFCIFLYRTNHPVSLLLPILHYIFSYCSKAHMPSATRHWVHPWLSFCQLEPAGPCMAVFLPTGAWRTLGGFDKEFFLQRGYTTTPKAHNMFNTSSHPGSIN